MTAAVFAAALGAGANDTLSSAQSVSFGAELDYLGGEVTTMLPQPVYGPPEMMLTTEETEQTLVPDGTGLVSVRVDDRFNVNLQFVEATGKVLCFVEVAQLPADTSKDVYRDLLAGGLFGKDTAGGYFALEPDTETVVYNYFFDGDRAAEDPEEFVSTIEKILQLCDLWAERLKAPGDSGDSSGDEVPDLQAFRIHA